MPYKEKKLLSFTRRSRERSQSHFDDAASLPGTVILSGSTGQLGAYLLHALLNDARFKKVFCLNRSRDARERQLNNHESRDLTTQFDEDRVEFLQWDVSAPLLGLSEPTYRRLASEVTYILHNAWPVDFNLHISSFEPHIHGVRQLVEFSCHSVKRPTIFFVSSVSAAANWGSVPGARTKVTETILEDWRLASMGYGQSKLISERLLAKAAETSGIRTAVCRVGQVAGPVLHGERGVWSKQEWLPSLIASSKFLGQIPETLGPLRNVDWVPVDLLANIVVDLLVVAGSTHSSKGMKGAAKTAVYHVANPSSVPWTSLLPVVTQALGSSVSVVNFADWVTALQNSTAETSRNVSDNPAIKLISFFENLQDKAIRFPRAHAATLDVQRTKELSEHLAALEPVNAPWMELWMRQWAF